ncbi:MAG: leucyl aminopeptidase [Candidatus Omnitrophica bacterium]|nr:leucyl aminopeptidase [Candidatus Omnitrophota bacterium]
MDITARSLGETKQKIDLLVCALFEGEKSPSKVLETLDKKAFQIGKLAVQQGRFSGKESEQFASYDGNVQVAKEVLFLGLGDKGKWTAEKLRKRVAGVLAYAKSQNAKSLRILAETFAGGPMDTQDTTEIIPETLDRADYRFDKYLTKKKDEPKREVKTVELLYSKKVQPSAIQKSITRARAIAEALNFTRTLINEPANLMPPRELARHAREVARAGKFRCQVLGPSEIKKLKMGGIIAVAQGSHEPAQFIIMEYGRAYKKHGTVCLVGKGVTFDTGGISIKPSRDMEKMKYDMSGAATVIGILKAVSRLKLPIHLVGLAPCVENMPGGGAQRPGDIIKFYNGKSAEVINTDAEGRLILADALAYSEKFKPKVLIDLATLTGACAVTFADKAIGVMSTDPALVQKIRKAGETTGERCWELPLWDEYFEIIKGHHSDIMNAGSGYGGTITAAMFLKEFVPIKSWAHLDIAGTAWVDSDKSYNARGATGVGVRLLLELFRNWK